MAVCRPAGSFNNLTAPVICAHLTLNSVAVVKGGAELLLDRPERLASADVAMLVAAIGKHGGRAAELIEPMPAGFDDELVAEVAILQVAAEELVAHWRDGKGGLHDGYLVVLLRQSDKIIELLGWTLRGMTPEERRQVIDLTTGEST